MKKYSLTWHKVEALKYARERIEGGRYTYICYALNDYIIAGGGNLVIRRKAAKYLINYISNQLGKHYSLGDWLRQEKGEDSYYLDFKQCRIQWIDWMIACYTQE